MSDTRPFIDPSVACPDTDSIQPNAVIVEGIARNGRRCRIVDNTASVDPRELREVLDALIQQEKFGRGGLSAKGGNTIALDRPTSSHVQLGGELYRLLLFPYEAHIERF